MDNRRYLGQYCVNITHNIIINNSQYTITHICQDSIPGSIFRPLLFVNWSINFDNQIRLMAVKINNKSPDHLLLPEMPTT